MQSARDLPASGSLEAAAFQASILDPEREKPASVTGPDGKRAVKRFNVYRNNVTVSLINALADIFPAVQRITGETMFRDMARAFVRAHPPSSPLLFRYGHAFPAFIETFEHARRMPYLADVARLERAWLTAYHAADRPPLSTEALAAVPGELLAGTTFQPHPAAGIIMSRFPVFDIFDVNRNRETVGRLDMSRPQAALVSRPSLDVVVTALPDGHGAFFDSLFAGQPLEQAIDAGARASVSFDLNEAISGILRTGAFVSVTPPEGEKPR